MNLPPPELLRDLSERLGWALLHSLWQGALVALTLAATLRLLRGRSAALLHTLCFLAFLVLAASTVVTATLIHVKVATPVRPSAPWITSEATPPAMDSPPIDAAAVTALPATPTRTSPASLLRRSVAKPSPAKTWRDRLEKLPPGAAALWAVGVLLLSIRHAGGWWRVRALRRHGTAPLPALQQTFASLCERYGLRTGAVRLLETVEAGVPMLTGLLRPVVLLPVGAFTGLTPPQLEAILAHELAHLVRRDAWSNLALVVLETLFFYHPAAWWIARRVREEREHAADDLALRVCTDRRVYAGALARLAEFQPVAPAFALAGTGDGKGGSLLNRVRRILQPPAAPAPTAPAGWSVLVPPALVAVVLVLGWNAHVRAEEARIIHVAPGQSIQAAIDRAPAGATIQLAAGEWRESVSVAKPLTLEGAGWEQTRVVVSELAAGEGQRIAREIQAKINTAKSNAEKRALETERLDQMNRFALQVCDTRDVVIRNLRFQGSTAGAHSGYINPNGPLVHFRRAQATLEGCAVVGPYDDGLLLEGGSDVEVRRTLVAAMWSDGILVRGARKGQGDEPDMAASRLHLVESEVRNNQYAGIGIGPGCNDTVIERSRISGSAWHGIRYDDASPTIVGNTIFGNHRCGIYASGETKATIRDNLFWRSEGTGIACYHSGDLIENNTFADNKGDAFTAAGGSRPVLTRNVFVGSPIAIYCAPTIDSRSNENSPEGVPTFTGNLFWENKVVIRKGGMDREEAPAPPGSVETDPRFRDAGKFDFTLAANASPSARVGAAQPLVPTASLWALTPEEQSIIPEGETRDEKLWNAPGAPKKRPPPVDPWTKATMEVLGTSVPDIFQEKNPGKRETAIAEIHANLESGDPTKIRLGLMTIIRVQKARSFGIPGFPKDFKEYKLDVERFRPTLRQLVDSPDHAVGSTSLDILADAGPNAEDLARVLGMVDHVPDDLSYAVRHALAGLSGGQLVGPVGEAYLKLISNPKTRRGGVNWFELWGATISPEIEARAVAASRERSGRINGYNNALTDGLTTHWSKREPTVTRLIETASQRIPEGDDTSKGLGYAHYVIARSLQGLRQGVAEDQQVRVADFALQFLIDRTDDYFWSDALALLAMYGHEGQVPVLEALFADVKTTDAIRRALTDTVAQMQARPIRADLTASVHP